MPQKYMTSAQVIRDKRREEFNAFVKTLTPQEVRRYNHEQTNKGKSRIRVKFPESSPRESPFMKYVSR